MLSLKGVIDNNNGHEEDVLELKQGLQQLGYYKTPKYGMTGYTDDETFEGVKRFQKDNDLTVDGVLKPGGETESKLNEHLNRRKTFEAPRTAASASAAESDDSMNRLHEKYKDTLVRRNLLTMSNVSDSFKAAIAQKESGEQGYKAYNSAGGGLGALGKYQLRSEALKDAGFLDNHNNWIGKNGIRNKDDFLNSPDSQEMAANKYFNDIEKQIKNKGIYKHLNKKIRINNSDIRVTKSGLIAAAHRQGAGKTNSCLNLLESNEDGSYSMNIKKLDSQKEQKKCQSVLTRMREFEKY